ncbi:hypothetical protein BS47DRAFT_1391779 [Hydnum rufescens UP504]|uniref:NACHT domain-containing protein n=1 Tax=Hydnum rufescens UP504 TaxID=1448309 RepID=A0A9P6DXU8_9AGAM|nr:hypothetical protein BS47DRAFT_1391779 [Hydnum rufescens UP504]
MKRSLKPGKATKGISLMVLQLAHNALDAIPLPGARGGIGTVLEVIEGVNKTSRNSSTLLDLENHIRFLTELLEPLTKMDQNNLSSGLKDEVQRLSRSGEYSSNVESKSSAGVVRRFLERQKDENDLHTFAQNLKAALDRFQVSQTLRQEQELLLERRSAAVISLPRADSAAYDSGRDDAPLSCLEGTRVSVLAEIMSWFESMESGTPPVYWLIGLAGIGKSTIAKTVAERADENGMLGGSFFFSRSDARLRDPQLVFPTLAFQLAQSDHEFKNIIGQAIQQDATLGHKKPLAQFEGLILKPLGQLDSHRRPTLIVLDALDECEEQGTATILQLLLAHITRLPFLRILITSRPEPYISSVFDEVRNLAKRILHDIEASVIEEDLRLYIRSELKKIPQNLGLQIGKLFIYAATSIRFIGDSRVRDPRNNLRLILDTQLSKESEATPYSQLDSLYVEVLRNSLSNSNRKVIVKRFQAVVGSIVLLRQPLPIGSLARFVQYTLDDVDTALRHLRSVIVPPSTPDEAPRIYHPSFRDFITDPSRCSIPEFVILAVPDQELRHALRCFELMATFLKQDIAGILDMSPLNSEVEGLNEKVRDALSAEVQYACSAVTSMEEAHRWAMNSKCETTIITILADAKRFILAHSELIRESVLQVYHSALAFTPCDTVLYHTYSTDVKSCVKVLQGVEAQWPQTLSTFIGHSGWVTSIAFSPDGLWLVSGSWDNTVCLWDAVLGTHIATLQGHSHGVASLVFSPAGLQIASGSTDESICLWDAMSGAILPSHSLEIPSLAFSPNGSCLASGSWDHTLHMWDAMSNTHISTLEGHSHGVTSVVFSPDSLWLASASLCLWDAISGMHIATLQGHSDWVSSVAFSPDGLQLISGSADHTLCLWDAMLGAHISTLQGHSGSVSSVAFLPNGLWLASGSYDTSIFLWDSMLGAHIGTLQGHSYLVSSVAFSPDGLQLTSGSWDYTLCLWDITSGMHIAPLQGHSGQVASVGSPHNSFKLQLTSGALPLQGAMSGMHIVPQGYSHAITSVTFSPDGLQLASSCGDHTLCLWDVMSGRHIATLQGHSDWVTSVTFSPDGTQLASASGDCTLCLWDAMLGAHIATLQGHSKWVSSVAFSPNGLQLASGSGDHTICLWDAKLGVHIATLEGHSGPVSSVAFSHNSSQLQLASGSHDKTVCLWDPVLHVHIATIEGHSGPVSSVAFSPNGLQLASGSWDHTVCLWDAMSGVCIATLEATEIEAVAFSFDGHTLISQTLTQAFAWDLTSQPPQLVSGSIPHPLPPTISLSSLIWTRVGGWIQALDSQGNLAACICYIPPHHSPRTAPMASSLISQSQVAIGCADGHVIIVDPQDHPFVHRLRQIETL